MTKQFKYALCCITRTWWWNKCWSSEKELLRKQGDYECWPHSQITVQWYV